ncbi:MULTISPECIES: ATP-binding protein [unclassified Marinimicrobium]|jgi:two-component system sensor histidine kinase RegB|uniref:sensor histidine kinase n=1 Tax=unclassified Marinimicrobium TaxID=2632100 RepID=UPI000C4CFAF7|nr:MULTISPECIES: ATP-binding protein [unclassified Marinimicrobium]MAN50950.1 histidine kinase [Marinimicrobium sp.]
MTPTERSPEQYLQWARWLLIAVLLVPIGQDVLSGTALTVDGWLGLWCFALAVQLVAYSPWPRAEHRRLSLHLLCDIVLWNGVVWLTGGATNPFAALLLIPLVLAFLLLPWRWAALLLIASIAGQLVQLVAVSDTHLGHDGMGGHFQAMVAGFVIAALLLALTLLYLRRQLHLRDLDLQRLRETQLRDEQLLAVGTAAAQLTHEMATPVQSIGLLLDEMELTLAPADRQETDAERQLIRRQLERIQGLLADWRLIAEDVRARRLQALPLDQLLQSVRQLLSITRPGEPVAWGEMKGVAGSGVRADRTLMPAILSLLNNALDAGGSVRVSGYCSEGLWRLDIDNTGRPLTPEQRARLGAECLPSDDGFGVGALVSYATLERFGGRVYWSGDDRSTRARLELPIQECSDGD